MLRYSLSYLALFVLIMLLGCKQANSDPLVDSGDTPTFEKEKAAILETLNQETTAAFNRDYKEWQNKWIHGPFVTKTYIDYPENHFTETLGWEEVDLFVRDFFESHPEPEPTPALLDNISVRLYGTGAWVTYVQNDSLRGRKRETRLMEKVDGQWKIAGMHTTIYGFEK